MNVQARLQAIIETGSRASGLDLHGADLVDADLCGLDADGLGLRAANLRGAALRRARLSGCTLQGAELAGADGSGAVLRMCALDGAHGVGARFDGTCMEDSSAKGADLTRASLRSAKLTETSFERAVLREAVFDDAEGDGVQFRGADLAGASLIGARLDEADFRGADLSRADLSRGRFHSADFRGAILDGARFDGADCAGARFDQGAGPHPAPASNADPKASASFDELAGTALRQGLAALPGVLAAREGATAEVLNHIQHAVDTLGAATDHPPEEWRPWLEPLLKMTKGERPIDPKAVLAALGEGPMALQDVFAAGGVPVPEFLARLQHWVAALDANPDQPPEEWKSWLEPLMKMTKEGQALDLKAVLDALSSLAQGQPSAATQTPVPSAQEPGRRG